MLDFDGGLLVQLQAVYSRPITVRPIVSQPGSSPYAARGVFSTGPVDAVSAAVADLAFSDQRTSVWIRAAEFQILPREGDQIEIPPILNLPGGLYEILDVDVFTTGKVVLTFKKPPQ